MKRFLLMALCLGAASAQDFTSLGSTWTSIGIQQSVMQSVIQGLPAPTKTGPATPAPVPSAAGNAQKLQYRPSAQLTRKHFAHFIARSKELDPAGSVGLEELLGDGFMGQAAESLAPYGLRPDNVADMFTLYWINAWEAGHGVPNPTTRAQAQAVKAQVVQAMLRNQQLLSANDATKQEMAEALLVQAALLSAYSDAAQQNPALKTQVMQAARQGALGMGLDLSQVKLTPQGFVPAK